MKLLKEFTQNDGNPLEAKVLVEECEAGQEPNYYIEGIFIQTNIKNKNGRIYPLDIVSKEIERYRREHIENKDAYGVLNHPVGGSPNIDLEKISHLITDVWQEGNNFCCKAKILDTPNGRIVKTLIKEGCRIGVSSRAMGSTTRKNGIDYVNDDLRYVTLADIVWNPSAPDAYTHGIMEDLEYQYDEKTDSYIPIAESKTISEEAITENQVKAFKDFFNTLK